MKTLKWMAIAVLLLASTAALAQDKDVTMRGLVDLVAQGEDDVRFLNTTDIDDSNFDALRARLFIEGGRENTQIFLQVLFSQQSFDDARLYGGYLLHKIFDDREIYGEGGLIPIHDGVWAHRTYSNKNPLVAIPLAYYWKSALPNRMMPNDLDDLVASSGQGQRGVVYADGNGLRGTPWPSTPILYDNCWNYGAYSLGVVRNVEYAVGVTLGAPGAPISTTDTNDNLAVHAKVGYAIVPGLKAHASVARGAYLSRDVIPFLPAGKTVNDYQQTLYIGSVAWQWNYLELLGEVFFNKFDTPLRADGLSNRSFYLQGVYAMLPGLDLAMRYDEMRFEEVQVTGGKADWDQDIQRVESGVIYHVSRSMLAKFVVQTTNTGRGWTAENTVPALQISFSF